MLTCRLCEHPNHSKCIKPDINKQQFEKIQSNWNSNKYWFPEFSDLFVLDMFKYIYHVNWGQTLFSTK